MFFALTNPKSDIKSCAHVKPLIEGPISLKAKNNNNNALITREKIKLVQKDLKSLAHKAEKGPETKSACWL